MKLHSKQKGSIGQLKIATELLRLGHAVFTELGDLSKVDLIALVNEKPIRIQVKAFTSKHGMVAVQCTKSGPNYHFRYKESQVDLFAVYVLDRDIVFFVTAKELLQNKRCCNFRIDPTMNNQTFKVRDIGDYLDFERVLRGHEQDILTGNAEDEDMVQTTTVKTGLGNQE